MKQIGTLGTIDTITVGGRVFTNLSGLIQLYGFTIDATNRYTSVRKPSSSSGYAPSGVIFQVSAVRIVNFNTNTQNGLAIFYSNNDLGVSSTTVPSSPVYIGGDSTLSEIVATTTTQGSETIFLTDFRVPSGKFLGFDNNAQNNDMHFQVYGYEV